MQSMSLLSVPETVLALQTWTDRMESMEKMLKLLPLPEATTNNMRLCKPCLTAAQERHNQAREEFWDGLPTYFKLPEWGDLGDFK